MSAGGSAKRFANYSLGALVLAVALDAAIVGFDPVTLAGIALPGTVPLALLALALVAGALAAVKRSLAALGVAVVALLVPALVERPWEMTGARIALSFAFGFATLVYAELVHASLRYAKWEAAAVASKTSTAGLEGAASEYARTFARVFALAIAAAVAVAAIYAALLAWGPAQHASSLDYRSFYGFIGAALLAFGAVALYALARGADWSRPGSRRKTEPATLGVDGEIVFHAQDPVVAPDGPK